MGQKAKRKKLLTKLIKKLDEQGMLINLFEALGDIKDTCVDSRILCVIIRTTHCIM